MGNNSISDENDNFGEYIRRWRTLYGYTQEEFAGFLGLSSRTPISVVENSKSSKSASTELLFRLYYFALKAQNYYVYDDDVFNDIHKLTLTKVVEYLDAEISARVDEKFTKLYGGKIRSRRRKH